MTDHTSGGDEPPDSAAETANRPFRTEWRNVDERRRERARREAAGASRDLAAELLAGDT
ncbi:hypothetical protein EGH21_12665 [Halomicroarcula sp. F13]|uniref:Uncharacterized protein n=1 Tax=Haloarcula rubra TaxID=2487747 RepID=A0AAW4PSB8_9EURY|nr:hypothetical protein [Halomicroarcula rubra]MBX0323883.1 hypothetical protein [Halomicroarcula rubra]